jgi:hypothetical protein
MHCIPVKGSLKCTQFYVNVNSRSQALSPGLPSLVTDMCESPTLSILGIWAMPDQVGITEYCFSSCAPNDNDGAHLMRMRRFIIVFAFSIHNNISRMRVPSMASNMCTP